MSKLDKSTIENLETFKDLFDHAHDLIHIVQPDGTILYINSAWEKLLAYKQEEVEGQSLYTFVVEEDQERFVNYRTQLINGIKSDIQITIRFRSKYGREIAVEGFISVRRDKEKALYTRGIFRDISSRLQKEQELKLSNQLLKERESNLLHLLTHAPDAIVVIDAASMITYWNPKAVDLFGWTAQEAIGQNLSDVIIPHQYREAHNRGMIRFLTTGEARVLNKSLELTALRKEGSEFYISLTISTSQQNGAPAFIAFIRNIEREKRNEIELDKKRKELEQSNQELEQFAHVASHDMKEPVRKIKIFAQQLKLEASDRLTPAANKFLEKIERAASRLNDMIEGVLAHSTVNTAIPLQEKVDLNVVVQQVLSELELVVQQRQAIIRAGHLPEVTGAPFLLYQLFYNLINNAMKFTRPGIAPYVEILASQKTLDNEETVVHHAITISDNGIGFSDKDTENIFRKFSRLHSNDKYEGTGLGLALCKSIVEKHNGFINASPGKEGGAVFTILLPVR